MSTKSSNINIQPGFEDLFSFSSKEERLEHRAQMISYRILSEVEKICDEKGIKKKELAKMVDTSASYITQLFRGDKQVNTSIMAKLEEALEMMFEVYARMDKYSHLEHMAKLLAGSNADKLKFAMKDYHCYYFRKGAHFGGTKEIVEEMVREDKRDKKEKGTVNKVAA
jgi:plasmid maintenance system antidote protein VapI